MTTLEEEFGIIRLRNQFQQEKERIKNHSTMTKGRKHLRLAKLYLSDMTPGTRRFRLKMCIMHCIISFFSRHHVPRD